jgi:hypothetical protein
VVRAIGFCMFMLGVLANTISLEKTSCHSMHT